MTTLAQILLAPPRGERIASDIANSIDRYVAELGGLKGLALKAGLKALKALRSDALHRGVARLLPEFAAALEPLFQRSRMEHHKDFGAYLGTHVDLASAAILGVMDARATSGHYRALAPIYQRLRGTIEGELKKVLPNLAQRIGSIATSQGPGP